LLFQTLDNKHKCIGVYCNGNLYFDSDLSEGLSKTWSYASFLGDREISYGHLQCGGKSLDEACPPNVKDDWEEINNKLKAFFRSFHLSKVSLDDNCFYDLVPEKFLLEFCEIKNRITKHVFENFLPPKNLRFLTLLTKVVEDISQQKLNIDIGEFKPFLAEHKARQWRKKIGNISPYIKYDVFGTKTGRLTTKKYSFPILTFPKKYRSIIKPNNDLFVELDYNGAELRTLLALSDKNQPSMDIHEWNRRFLSGDKILSRQEVKNSIFAWLYNSKKHQNEETLIKMYDKDKVLKNYWDGELVKTCFNREIPADKHHALNYIIQSTCADLILQKMIKIYDILKNKKSNIAFCIHDSIVIDLHTDDKYLMKEIIEEFANTRFGRFKTSVKTGKDFGDLRELIS
tara:strand:- start:2518 stop:3717 length:1200 start_codon:yes stop_codon:yes gene_type:complete